MKEKVEQEAGKQLSEFVDQGGSLSLEQLMAMKESIKLVYHGKIIEKGDEAVKEV